MKIALLAGASSIHTIRWANGLAKAGLQVHLITQHPPIEPLDKSVRVIALPYRGNAGYFLMVPALRRLLRRLKPDVLNAHYASGYATSARLSGFHPWLLSVWGSDVYDFPMRSRLHRWWVQRNLVAADRVASTSRCMAEKTRSLAPSLKDIAITPFGVDVDAFSNRSSALSQRDLSSPIVIGTVKVLAWKYGVDVLVRAFARVRADLERVGSTEAARLRLRIVGDGPDREMLQKLAAELGLASITEFVGRVPHDRVAGELEKLDVYVALSRLESFGVAVVEAGAAGRPVVVSNEGGLPEVVIDGETGLVVARDDPAAAADAIKTLVLDKDLRVHMGEAGFAHVSREYSWAGSVVKMIEVLQQTREAASAKAWKT